MHSSICLVFRLLTSLSFVLKSVQAWSPSTPAALHFSLGQQLEPSIGSLKASRAPSDFTVLEDNEEEPEEKSIDSSIHSDSALDQYFPSGDGDDEEGSSFDHPKQRETKRMNVNARRPRNASWMQRNNDFVSGGRTDEIDQPMGGRPQVSPRGGRSFRQDFQGSRVFVQGIPKDVSWQTLKDHFQVAGKVVFASVSVDHTTGESKGHGLVQFETTEMALTAIAIMRDYPLNGHTLYVREDVKEEDETASLKSKPRQNQSWKCADEDNVTYLSDSDRTEVLSLIRARDDARRRRNYEISDSIREELKIKFGVHIDDRLKMWWSSMDGKDVPTVIRELKGQGRWGQTKQLEWRQIPTTPENDACVNPDLVEGLLSQRDIARREKDFKTADMLLEEARNSPDNDLKLRIHDESRTWRVWTEAPPPKPFAATHLSPAERCIAIVEDHAPEKVSEIEELLERFPGREYKILKRLKQKYLKPSSY